MLRRAIRNLGSGLFLLDDMWVKDGTHAQNFLDDKSAMVALEVADVQNAELVMVNEDGHVSSGRPLRLSNQARPT